MILNGNKHRDFELEKGSLCAKIIVNNIDWDTVCKRVQLSKQLTAAIKRLCD